MAINNSLKKLRENKGVTQEELAAAASVSRQTIIAIEKGNYTPSLELAFLLARFFKKDIESVFTFKR